MDRFSTKDQYEREQDEAARLVRPAPKDKPPRRDLRREHVDTEEAEAEDKDLSHNYKTIGGSTPITRRVAFRYLLRQALDGQTVKVVRRDNGKTDYVTPERLKAHPEKYQVADGSEKPPTENPPQTSNPQAPPKPPSAPKPPAAPAVDQPPPPPEVKEPEQEPPAKEKPQQDNPPGISPEMAEKARAYMGKPGVEDIVKEFLRDPNGRGGKGVDLAFLAGLKPPRPIRDPEKQKEYFGAETYTEARDVARAVSAIKDWESAKGKEHPPAKKHKTPPAAQPQEPPASPPPAAPQEQPTAPPQAAPQPPAQAPAPQQAPAQQQPVANPPAPPPGAAPQPQAGPPQAAPGQPAPTEGAPAKPKAKPAKPRSTGEPEEWAENLKRTLQDAADDSQAFRSYAEKMPSGKTDPETGKALFRNPGASGKGDRFVPFEKLPPHAQQNIANRYSEQQKGSAAAEELAKGLDEKTRGLLEGLEESSSPLGKRIWELKRKHNIDDEDDITIERAIPELKGKLPPGIESLSDLKKAVAARPDLFEEVEPLAKWIKDGGPKSKEFREFAEKEHGVDGEGRPTFKDRKTQKNVTFDELDPRTQEQVQQEFQSHGRSNELREQQRKNPKLRNVLQDLSNPESELSRRLSESRDLSEVDIEKAIPELRGLTLPEGMSNVEELTQAAKKIHPPIPDPPRRAVTEEQQQHAAHNVFESVPARLRKDPGTLRALGSIASLHPDDMQVALNAYLKTRNSKMGDVSEVADKARHFYTDHPEQVRPPPNWVGKDDKEHSFDDLSPEEKSEAMARHKAEVLGLSLAAKLHIDEALRKDGAPMELASRLSSQLLSAKSGKDTPERVADAEREARATFDSIITSGKATPISDDQAKKLLSHLKNDPAARKVAVGYMQANDYMRGLDHVLSKEGGVSERDSSHAIASQLLKASKDLQAKESLYGNEGFMDTGKLVRERILDKLDTLDPEKSAKVRKKLQKFEAEEFVKKYRRYEEEVKNRSEGSYRDAPGPEPVPPTPPEGYVAQGEEGGKLMDQQLRRLGVQKTASRVALRFAFSSCETLGAMGSSSTPMPREALYHGIAPYPKGNEGFAPYVPWTQVHQRDLGPADSTKLLTAARDWLKQSVLSVSVEGIVRDTQLRAALDLSIQTLEDGRYSGAIQPNLYNELLAKLAGESVDETLLTVREASNATFSYAETADKETHPMKASAEIRDFAIKAASTHPELAYDLNALASRVAQEEQMQQEEQVKQAKLFEKKEETQEEQAKQAKLFEKKPESEKKDDDKGDKGDSKPPWLKDKIEKEAASYQTLRSTIIHTAASDPVAKQILLPVLQTIQKLG